MSNKIIAKMDSYVRPPDPLSGDGDMVQNWDRWRKDFVIYLKASDYAKKSGDIQAYLLRSHIGKVGQDAIEKIFPKNSTERDRVDVLLNKLSNYFNPPKNEVIERYNFFTRVWKPQESIEDYIEDLKQKAATCNFGNMKNSLIRDKIIAGFKDKNLRKKLFETTNLDLPKLIAIHNEHKMSLQEKAQTNKKDTTSAKTVEAVASSSGNNHNTKKMTTQNQQSYNPEHKRNCWRCEQKHSIKSCPAWGFKCQRCNELHHFTFCCRNKFQVQTNTNLPNSNQYQQNQYPLPLIQTNNVRPPTYHNTSPPAYYNTPPPMVPSAPPLPPRQPYYPNLNKNSSSQSWPWAEQQNMRSKEIFQKSETSEQSTDIPQSTNSTKQSNSTNNSKTTTNKEANTIDDKCKVS
ncbi:uncharacterized protein LOC128874938 isoform X2 [Hylaeus volcanicus]|uniref:uncharacterized protein LOC128874938 isoform X2 n=1 Tax=Hylaeus volcanicus TaxID=313075 RepID=UPI0023B86E75|nr:uncharacterized protein LOC128874938 isoform X2 [Hylaeus volcanicus]